MQMTPPSGGDTFVGRDGFTVTSPNSSTAVNVNPAAVAQAIARGWTQVPPTASSAGNFIVAD